MTTRMKKAIAAGLIGLTGLGATAIVPNIAEAQEAETQELEAQTEQAPTQEERDARGAEHRANHEARRAEHRANHEARRAERIALLTDVLGVDEAGLQAARDAGQSIADVATAQSVPVDDVVNAIVEAQTASIQARVDSGDITQDEADTRLAGLVERVTEKVNAAPGDHADGHRGHRGLGRGAAPAQA